MKPKTIHFWRGHLPHWEVKDGRYFVTIHLRGAIPRSGQARIRELARQLHQPNELQSKEVLRLQRLIFAEMEAWLDRVSPVGHLRDQRLAEMVVEAIKFRQEQRVWNMFAYTIMPSHIHLFFETPDGHIKKVLEQFKRWTGHQAARILNSTDDRFWQEEWFDHWSRSSPEDEKILKYIFENAVKAGLVAAPQDWIWQSPRQVAQ